ncbi:MAG: glycerophosphodiester phosphodiesterase family protein [Solirubrobacteraceae bacterium]
MTPPVSEVAVVAHRGIVCGFPENTVAACREAVSQGFAAIEVDLRATSDGHIVVMHDGSVDRTTNGSGAVDQLTLAEIRSLDAGAHAGAMFAGELVPTLEEVFDCLHGSGTKLLLDLKSSPLLDSERVTWLIARHSADLDVILGPRSLHELRDYKRLNPNLQTLALVPGEEFAPADQDVIEQFVGAGADIVRLWPPWIFADRDQADRDQDAGARRSPLIERLHQVGTPVWTTADVMYRDINPDAPAEDLAELGRLAVDGIITDVPELLRQVLAARRSP